MTPVTVRARPARRAVAMFAVATAVSVAMLAGAWLWLRDSSLVAVRRVRVTGLLAPDAARIRAALVTAARSMTTLDVRTDALRAAVSPYPIVKGLGVSTQFPHGLEIRVTEQVPVAAVMVGGHLVPVAADGTVLRDVAAGHALPVLALKAAPGGPRIQDRGALVQLRVLAAAPEPLLTRITGVGDGYWTGLVIRLRKGPSILFGAAAQLGAKWQAALAVLAAPQTAGAAYIDVSDPRRPAAGAGTPMAAAGAGGSGSPPTG